MRPAWPLALLVAAGLAGCLGDQAEAPTRAFAVPALPDEFHAVYVDRDGQQLVVDGRVHRSLGRDGTLQDLRIVRDDRGRAWGLDACGPPAWSGETLDGRVTLLRPFVAPAWLMLQGIAASAGLVLDAQGNTSATVLQVQDNGATVQAAGYLVGSATYDGGALPERWSDLDGVMWSLQDATVGPAAPCAEPRAAPLLPVGKQGPQEQPTFPTWSLPEVLDHAGGLLGPPEYREWLLANPAGWLASATYAPPLADGPASPVLRPATWTLHFTPPRATATLVLTCSVDERDAMGIHVAPGRCQTSSGEALDATARDHAPVLPDVAVLEATLVGLGLTPTAYAFHSTDLRGHLQLEAWETTGTTTSIFFVQLDEAGRLAWASLPSQAGLLG